MYRGVLLTWYSLYWQDQQSIQRFKVLSGFNPFQELWISLAFFDGSERSIKVVDVLGI